MRLAACACVLLAAGCDEPAESVACDEPPAPPTANIVIALRPDASYANVQSRGAYAGHLTLGGSVRLNGAGCPGASCEVVLADLRLDGQGEVHDPQAGALDRLTAFGRSTPKATIQPNGGWTMAPGALEVTLTASGSDGCVLSEVAKNFDPIGAQLTSAGAFDAFFTLADDGQREIAVSLAGGRSP